MQAYQDFLVPGRYPACLLYLRVPTTEVDVNVHPTKHEVRFVTPRLVHDFVCSQLQDLLNNHEIVDNGTITNVHPEFHIQAAKRKLIESEVKVEFIWHKITNQFI